MKTVKHNAQRDNWQHDVLLSVFNRLFNLCSMTQGRRDSIVNHEKAYSAYFELKLSDDNRRNMLENIK